MGRRAFGEERNYNEKMMTIIIIIIITIIIIIISSLQEVRANRSRGLLTHTYQPDERFR